MLLEISNLSTIIEFEEWMIINLGINPTIGGMPAKFIKFKQNNVLFPFLKLNVLSSVFVLKFLSIV